MQEGVHISDCSLRKPRKQPNPPTKQQNTPGYPADHFFLFPEKPSASRYLCIVLIISPGGIGGSMCFGSVSGRLKTRSQIISATIYDTVEIRSVDRNTFVPKTENIK